jgi:(2Fe-2S) ferredoxin
VARVIVLVARPTPSGVDERALRALAVAVEERSGLSTRAAYLDQADPSVAAVLDEVAATAGTGDEVIVIPLALPADAYLRNWIARAVAHWREPRGSDLPVVLAPAPSGMADLLAGLALGHGTPVTVSPAWFRSPAWSTIARPARHLFVCRGSRCTVYGAGDTHRSLAAAAKGRDVQVTPTGCLGPCNLGPLVIDHPSGRWHESVDGPTARALLDAGPDRTDGETPTLTPDGHPG